MFCSAQLISLLSGISYTKYKACVLQINHISDFIYHNCITITLYHFYGRIIYISVIR